MPNIGYLLLSRRTLPTLQRAQLVDQGLELPVDGIYGPTLLLDVLLQSGDVLALGLQAASGLT